MYLGRTDFTQPVLNSCLGRKLQLNLFLKIQVNLRFQSMGWGKLACLLAPFLLETFQAAGDAQYIRTGLQLELNNSITKLVAGLCGGCFLLSFES